MNSKLLSAIYSKTNANPESRLRITVYSPQGEIIGHLLLVDSLMARDDLVIDYLTKWRQKFMKYFLTQFVATNQRTKEWLKSVLHDDERLFFVITLPTGELIGNFGLCNLGKQTGELDNLIRGEKGGTKDLIFCSEVSLLSWMFSVLELQSSSLHVFSNNIRTLRLHETVGFEIVAEYPLYRIVENDLVKYSTDEVDGDLVDFKYLKMSIKRDQFFKMHPWAIALHLPHT